MPRSSPRPSDCMSPGPSATTSGTSASVVLAASTTSSCFRPIGPDKINRPKEPGRYAPEPASTSNRPVPFVKAIHGSAYSVTKIKLDGPSGPTRLAKETRQTLERLRLQIESTSALPLILNDHCPSCEYRWRCRAEAIQKDDLSLLP